MKLPAPANHNAVPYQWHYSDTHAKWVPMFGSDTVSVRTGDDISSNEADLAETICAWIQEHGYKPESDICDLIMEESA